jgi:mannose/fructose/N-acetylgalactosamine-specific phosphotransferase system component IID
MIEMDDEKNKKSNLFQEIFDALFIMIICFATLLTAMLMKGRTVGTSVYIVHITTLAVTVFGLGVYLYFVLRRSEKELKGIVSDLYNS